MSGTWSGSYDGVTYTGTIQLSRQSGPSEASGAIALNTPTAGAINTVGQVDDWTFYGTTGESVAVQLNPGAEGSQPAAYPQVGWGQVDLIEPNNDILASASSSSSGSIAAFNDTTLPANGTYTIQLQVPYGEPVNTGNYVLSAYNVTSLTLGTPYNGTLAGSGQSQLFAVNVPSAQALLVTVQDSSSADVNELYAKLGSPPTPYEYDDSSANGYSADPQLLVSSAAPGTWYILLDSESVPAAPSRFTLSAVGTPMSLTGVTPTRSATGSPATLVLTGSGFNNTTSVELIGSNKTVYKAETTTLDTFTQLTATFTLSGVPQGVYSVEATGTGGQSAELPSAFTVTAAGSALFEDHLILPGVIGLHTATTFYVEYSNEGSVAMPAPLLILQSSNSQDLPLLTLNSALAVSGYRTSATPEGYSNTVEILASGKVPGWLEPGESITEPVYYAGMQKATSSTTNFPFNLVVYNDQDSTAADLSSLQAGLQPPGMSSTAWSAIFGVLTAEIGTTWGGYVTMLDNEASYLGSLGEDVTDVVQLWSFAVMLADGLTPASTLAGGTDLDMVVPGELSLDFSRLYQEPISAQTRWDRSVMAGATTGNTP